MNDLEKFIPEIITLEDGVKEIKGFYEKYQIYLIELHKEMKLKETGNKTKKIFFINPKEEDLEGLIERYKKEKNFKINGIDINKKLKKTKMYYIGEYKEEPTFFISEKEISKEEFYQLNRIFKILGLWHKKKEIDNHE